MSFSEHHIFMQLLKLQISHFHLPKRKFHAHEQPLLISPLTAATSLFSLSVLFVNSGHCKKLEGYIIHMPLCLTPFHLHNVSGSCMLWITIAHLEQWGLCMAQYMAITH